MIRAVLLAVALASPASAAPTELALEMSALNAWLGGPPGPLPMTRESPRVVIALSRANEALALGDPSAALDATRAALHAMPDSVASCDFAGAVRSLEIDLLRLTVERGVPGARAALHQVCPTPADGPRPYWIERDALITLVGADRDELPQALQAPAARRAERDRLVAWAADLPPARRALIEALAEHLVVAHEPAESSCDLDHEERRRERLRSLELQLDATGRPDLAASLKRAELAEASDKAAVAAALLAWTGEPERTIVRDPVRLSAWNLLESRITPDMATAWCPVIAGIAQRWLADPGWDARRTGLLLPSIIGYAEHCEDGGAHDDGAPFTTEAMRRAIRTPDLAGFGDVATQIFVPGLGLFFGMGASPERHEAIDRLLKRALAEPPPDAEAAARAAVVRAYLQIFKTSQSDNDLMLGRIRQELAAAVAANGVGKSGLHRDLPALIAIIDAALAVRHLLHEQQPAAGAALARIDPSADPALRRWLQLRGAKRHRRALRDLAHAARLVIPDRENPDLPALRDALDRASRPGRRERGEWRIGLALARVLLWDAAAALHHAKDPDLADRALATTETLLADMIGGAIAEYAEPGTAFELLNLVPGVHSLMLAELTRGEAPLEAAAAAPFRRAMTVALERIPSQVLEASPEELGHAALLRDTLFLVADLLEALAASADEQTSPGPALEAFSRRIESYSGDTRALAHLGLSLLQQDGDPQGALALNTEALEVVTDPELQLVFQLRAGALAGRAGDHETALAHLNRALVPADQAAQCGRSHPTEAARPLQAITLARLGRDHEAMAALSDHLMRVAEGQTPGAATTSCTLTWHRHGLQLSGEIRLDLQSATGGNVHLNAGAASYTETAERLFCETTEAMAQRRDRWIEALLLRGLLNLRAGRRPEAERDLLAAADATFQLANLTIVDGEQALSKSMALSREEPPLELLVWVGSLTFLHGHPRLADLLLTAASSVARWTDGPLADAIDEDLPWILRDLGFEDFAPAARAVALSQPAPDVLALLDTLPPEAAAVARPARLLALRDVDPQRFDAELTAARASETDPIARAILANLALERRGTTDDWITATRALAEVGLPGEAASFALGGAIDHMGVSHAKEVDVLLTAARDLLPRGAARTILLHLTSARSSINEDFLDDPGWRHRLLDERTGLRGLMTGEPEAQLMFNLAVASWWADERERALPAITWARAIAASLAGRHSQQAMGLSIILEAMNASLGQPDLRALKVMTSWLDLEPEPQIRALVDDLIGACEGKAERCTEVADAILLGMIGR